MCWHLPHMPPITAFFIRGWNILFQISGGTNSERGICLPVLNHQGHISLMPQGSTSLWICSYLFLPIFGISYLFLFLIARSIVWALFRCYRRELLLSQGGKSGNYSDRDRVKHRNLSCYHFWLLLIKCWLLTLFLNYNYIHWLDHI